MTDTQHNHSHHTKEEETMSHAEKVKKTIPDSILQQAAEAVNEPGTAKDAEKIVQLEAEVASLKDALLRAHAEVENTRRRAKLDVEDAGKYAITQFARDLINVLENLHRAEDSIPQDQLADNALLKNIFDGVEMTRKELLSVLDRHGIKRLDPKGEAYDHHFHQAMMQMEDATVPPDTVVQVLQAGYVIKDRLLRPALVAVSKAPETRQE